MVGWTYTPYVGGYCASKDYAGLLHGPCEHAPCGRTESIQWHRNPKDFNQVLCDACYQHVRKTGKLRTTKLIEASTVKALAGPLRGPCENAVYGREKSRTWYLNPKDLNQVICDACYQRVMTVGRLRTTEEIEKARFRALGTIHGPCEQSLCRAKESNQSVAPESKGLKPSALQKLLLSLREERPAEAIAKGGNLSAKMKVAKAKKSKV